MEWVKCSDILPEEGVKVLIYLEKDEEFMINYIINFPEPVWACILQREEYQVSHWMPLPPIPME